jgi:hypothetical protein
VVQMEFIQRLGEIWPEKRVIRGEHRCWGWGAEVRGDPAELYLNYTGQVTPVCAPVGEAG